MSSERDRDMFLVLRIIRGMSAKEVAKKAKLSTSTIYKWRRRVQDGGTRYPKHDSMARILRAAGYEFVIQHKATGQEVKRTSKANDFNIDEIRLM